MYCSLQAKPESVCGSVIVHLHAEGYRRSSLCPLFTVAGCAGCKTREVFACPLTFLANDLTSRQMLFMILQ